MKFRLPHVTGNWYYYSFKIFSRFWLVKTTRIIHNNQLLFTKFGKNLRHIERMTSKVQPAKNYWTVDVKMTSKVQPAADYWTVDRENLRTSLRYIWWAEKEFVGGFEPKACRNAQSRVCFSYIRFQRSGRFYERHREAGIFSNRTKMSSGSWSSIVKSYKGRF